MTSIKIKKYAKSFQKMYVDDFRSLMNVPIEAHIKNLGVNEKPKYACFYQK